MSQAAVLVIDVGTSALKASLFDFRCRTIDRVSCAHQTGSLDAAASAERWWTVAAGAAAALRSRNQGCEVAAVGLTGFMHSVIPLDQSGEPVPLPRGGIGLRSCFDRMIDRFGVEKMYDITGSRLDVTSVPPQLLAWREQYPAQFSRVTTVVPVKDFIRYRLTGNLATEPIDASGTLLYDIHRARWDGELCSYCSIAPEHLPPLLRCTERAGGLAGEAAARLGLPEGTPVSTGGGDDIEILGSGARYAGEICEHVGSTGSFLLPSETPCTDPACRLELYPAIARGEWVLGGSCSNIARALDWFLEASNYYSNGEIDWQRVDADLCAALAGFRSDRPLFLPYLHGERVPLWNPGLTGAWTGLRYTHTPGDLLLSTVEGICFSLRGILDIYDELGIPVKSVHSSGGFNRLPAAVLRASIYGRPIRLVRGADPTSFAAAALALCAIGELSDPAEAAEWLEYEPEVEPEPLWQAMLEERFARFAEHTRELAGIGI